MSSQDLILTDDLAVPAEPPILVEPQLDENENGAIPTIFSVNGVESPEIQDLVCVHCGGFPAGDPFDLLCGHGLLCANNCKDEFKCTEAPDCAVENPTEKANAKTRRLIREIKLKCLRHRLPNVESGCEWEGRLVDWKRHVKDECEYRLLQCDKCPESFRAKAEFAEEHERVGKHLECPLMEFGIACTGGMMNQEELAQHNQKFAIEHINVLARHFSEQINVLRDRNLELEETVRRLDANQTSTNDSVQGVSEKSTVFEQDLCKIFELLNEMNSRVVGCEYSLGLVSDLPHGQTDVEIEEIVVAEPST